MMNRFNFQFLASKFNSIEWRTRVFPWALSFLCIVAVFLYWALIVGFQSLKKVERFSEEVKTDPFTSLHIEAKSAYVWDVVNERPLYEKDAYSPRPLASLTKVMTAVTAAEIAPSISNITIKLADLSPEGDSKLKVESEWNIKNLIDYVLLVSSNDGAHALAASIGATRVARGALDQDVSGDIARGLFIAEMNELARKIGLTHSTFLNEHGLDSGDVLGGAYGSARDSAILFEYAMRNYPSILEATRYPELQISDRNRDAYSAKNTNEIINSIPSPIASKTGYTALAGGNLVVAFDSGLGRPIIISVLGSTADGRFTDMLKLVDASMKYLQSE